MEIPPGAVIIENISFTTPLEEVVKLQKEVEKLKHRETRLTQSMRKKSKKWRNEKRALLRKVKNLGKKAKALDAILAAGILSTAQVRQATSGNRVKWDSGDVSKALGLRCLTRKGYKYAQKVLKIPLPSASTLSRWSRSFRLTSGVMEAAVAVLEAAVQGMSAIQRLCVLSFDEMALDSRYCYDASSDQVLTGSKLQVLMVRALCASWKQPLFYELDAPMTPEKLADVILRLESLGLSVVAVVSDMGVSNENMWRDAGVTDAKTWIANPADETRLMTELK